MPQTYNGLSPNQIGGEQILDWKLRELPLEYPDMPLVNTQFEPAGTIHSMSTNPHCPVFAANYLGAQPEFRFTGMPPLAMISLPTAQDDITNPCASVNQQQFERFAPMLDEQDSNNYINDVGAQHGDDIGIYSTPIHPVDNNELEYPASYFAWMQNPIPSGN